MRQKVLGIVLLILGIYFVLINPIISVLVHAVFNLRIDVPLNPLVFWIDALRVYWLWITILVAGAGVVLLRYGRRYALKVQV